MTGDADDRGDLVTTHAPDASLGKPLAVRLFLGLFVTLAIAGASAFLLQLFVLELVRVSGDSMWPGVGPDALLLSYRHGTPERGDLVLLQTPEGKDQVRRVVALPGDRLRIADSTPVLNGKPAAREEQRRVTLLGRPARIFAETIGDRRYEVLDIDGRRAHDMPPNRPPAGVSKGTAPPPSLRVVTANGASGGTEYLIEGGVYVLADHRDDASDSRFYGVVPKDRLRGVIVRVIATGRAP
ncbi:MAG: signal peptidase I [Myxococcales bacterium]|nr:signal peptidase I [Myxococcales bacterium]